MVGLQSGLTPNIPHALNEQSQYLAHVIGHALQNEHATIEASEQAERDWVQMIQDGAGRNSDFQEGCTPGYYNNEGRPGDGDGWFGGFYPDGSEALFQMWREWRATGTFEGLEFS